MWEAGAVTCPQRDGLEVAARARHCESNQFLNSEVSTRRFHTADHYPPIQKLLRQAKHLRITA